MKTIKENISSREFKKLMIYTRSREELRRNFKIIYYELWYDLQR